MDSNKEALDSIQEKSLNDTTELLDGKNQNKATNERGMISKKNVNNTVIGFTPTSKLTGKASLS